MKRALLLIIVGALYVLHQDFWFWREARPFVFGFLPIGLFYHACYTLATALVMWLLVKHAWPSHLEDGWAGEGMEDRAMERGGEERRGDGARGRRGEERRGDGARGRGGEGETRESISASPRLPIPLLPIPLLPIPPLPVRLPIPLLPIPLLPIPPLPVRLPIPLLPIPPLPIPLLPVPSRPVASEKGGADQ